MKTYLFQAVLEQDKWPDEPDEKAVWRAYIPALEHKGAASWGYTEKEALENLENAVDLLVAHLLEVGEDIPTDPPSQIQVKSPPNIARSLSSSRLIRKKC